MNITSILQLIISALTLLGIIFAIYKFFRDPDIKSEKNIALMQDQCVLKHQYLDKDIGNIYKEISDIRKNHLDHIERDINQLKIDVTRILTILEERFKK